MRTGVSIFLKLLAIVGIAAITVHATFAHGVVREVAALPEGKRAAYAHKGAVEHAGQSTYVMFKILTDGTASVIAAREANHPVSPCRELTSAHTKKRSRYVVVRYTHPVDGKSCDIPVLDPRRMYHDAHDEEGSHKGGMFRHNEADFAVSLHPGARDVTVTDYASGSEKVSVLAVTLDHHRAFNTMNTIETLDPSLVVATPLQVVGSLSRQRNFVFLSDGFLASQEAEFNNAVMSILNFMQQPLNNFGVSSQPYYRYFSIFNIYSVFYPSPDEGPSVPAPAGSGVVSNDNLGCSYGPSSTNILACVRASVLLLGSYAPPEATQTVYIVLVNSNASGSSGGAGSGGGGVATIYTGENMPLMFMHEMGHAMTGLADEYSYGISETEDVEMYNCYWTPVYPPWTAWILAGILPQATQGCTYTNYFKPTPDTCIMENISNPSLCPVCLEQSVEEFYEAGMDLSAPRYPGPYETLVLVNGQVQPIAISSVIPGFKDTSGSFTVTWTQGGTVIATGVSQIAVAPAGASSAAVEAEYNVTAVWNYPGVGDFNVTVIINDNTNMILASNQAMYTVANLSSINQNHTFRISIVSSTAAQTASGCVFSSGSLPVPSYCSICDPGHSADCELTFTAMPLNYTVDVVDSYSGLQTWLLGVGAAFAGIGIIIMFGTWKGMQYYSQTRVNEVLPLTPLIKNMRVGLMGLQCFLLLATTVALCYAGYMYSIMTVYGKTVLVGVIVVGCLVWITSFVGFTAAYYKNRMVLFVNFVILLILGTICFLFAMLAVYVLTNIDSSGVQSQLELEWQQAVSSYPSDVCTLQSALSCSGFTSSCAALQTTGGTSDCPSNCFEGNLAANPCLLNIRTFVVAKYTPISAVGGAFAGLMILCSVLTIILGCKIKDQKIETNEQRLERQARGENALSPEEVEMLMMEFKKIDKDGSGDISREEFGNFYNDVMGTELSQRQLDEYFDKLDADGSGALSFEEFVRIYRPLRHPSRRSLRDTSDSRDLAHTSSGFSAEDDSEAKVLTPTGSSLHLEHTPGTGSGTARSLQSDKGALMAELDLQLDDDIDLFMEDEGDLGAMQLAAEQQAKAAREQQAAVAAAQAERQKRHALDTPAVADVSNVLGDLHQADEKDEDLKEFENMDLEIDLDHDTY